MEERPLALTLAGVAAIHLSLVAAGLPAWQCPIRAATGIPCPGCGLSTATALLLRGRWQESLAQHAFAPVFLFGAALLVVVSAAPERMRMSVIGQIERLERRTGLTAIILIGLVVYWLIRLLVLHNINLAY